MNFSSLSSVMTKTAYNGKGIINAAKLGELQQKPYQPYPIDQFLGNPYGTIIDTFAPQDCFLREHLGYRIGNHNSKKTISRYQSSTVQQVLNYSQKKYSEDKLFGDIKVVLDSCNLGKTTCEKLPNLSSVGTNLTIDASSKLSDLSGLKSVGGFLNVVADDKCKMHDFLLKLGLIDKNNKLCVSIGKGVRLFRNHLGTQIQENVETVRKNNKMFLNI